MLAGRYLIELARVGLIDASLCSKASAGMPCETWPTWCTNAVAGFAKNSECNKTFESGFLTNPATFRLMLELMSRWR
ncbi:hypothetical protein RB9830 [Rhodopirellula baltica SH 1]|uniref:Uncharacterized protein n=1 Tax=Rhodopirellula baltica (strain DSM 10527 / NCIMB 13988 / SH1) TaxID=243090 RepID=Q7UL01_RHOBA|nr:hypothetical protein RB9830 [Rhodopirellula baltica SH 1]